MLASGLRAEGTNASVCHQVRVAELPFVGVTKLIDVGLAGRRSLVLIALALP